MSAFEISDRKPFGAQNATVGTAAAHNSSSTSSRLPPPPLVRDESASPSPLSSSSGYNCWSPHGLCSSPPSRQRTSPSCALTAKDRFIPCRSPLDANLSHFLLEANHDEQDADSTPTKQDYMNTLKESVLQAQGDAKVLPFRDPRMVRGDTASAAEALQGTSPPSPAQCVLKRRRTSRFIPKSPDKILDAPDLVDDYYLNLLDWSKSNILAVALRQCVFLWNASTDATQKLLETSQPGNIVTSLAWGEEPGGSTLAVGTHSAEVQLWDVAAGRMIRSMQGHRSRVSSLSWSGNTVSSGSRDSVIMHHDVRAPQHRVGELHGHSQEVCGLKWCPQATQLASGGNDNVLNIWEARRNTSRFSINRHQAAVKALAWCPFQTNLLASGGGTADRRICLWNTGNGQCLNEVDTKSQVCAIQWSVHDREFVSSHGFTHNQLILWRYAGAGRVHKVVELTGHQARVLHMAQSPDGTTIVSAAADETLRFWRILGSPTRSAAKLKMEHSTRGLLGANCIR
uniref:CDC20/Fizzy WD40 domain-containing protein n=1 Tax=Hemiselmis andersenii TaxID=464988 RepID=A0A6U4K7Y3_HEMAN|mmetsp:Transcript_31110/g.72713  ORF Transcript_31110/g.72713 Transcript_31110/m.72713 type:complete len:512 (+) Transcript_31110:590-2125(+)